MPVRSALATRTIFNILGPLTNPSHPDYAVIGVYDTALIKPVAQTLKELGMKRGLSYTAAVTTKFPFPVLRNMPDCMKTATFRPVVLRRTISASRPSTPKKTLKVACRKKTHASRKLF